MFISVVRDSSCQVVVGNNLRQQHLSFGLTKERVKPKDQIEQVIRFPW